MGIRRALCLLFFATKMAIETAIFTLLGKGFWGLWFCSVWGFFVGFLLFFQFCLVWFWFCLIAGGAGVQFQYMIEGMQKVKSEMENFCL